MKHNSEKIHALLQLLEDEDSQVYSLAMEQLLQEHVADDLVKEFQEAQNPLLRVRMHQLGNVLSMRRRRRTFIRNARLARLTLWDGLLQINHLYNQRMNPEAVNLAFEKLIQELPPRLSAVRVATFMKEHGFGFAGEDTLAADLYLIEDVIAQHVGAPVVMSIIAKCLGERVGWDASIVLYKGKHCLLDCSSNLVEPADGWKVTHLPLEERLESCADSDIWLTVLSQLFLAAMLEGRLPAIHRVGSILAELCGGGLSGLPYPLGSQ